MKSSLIIVLILSGLHPLLAKTGLPELLSDIEQSIPAAYRYPDAVAEMRELPKSDAQVELKESISLASFEGLDLKALNETQKAILFKAAQGLPPKQYIRLLDIAYALAKDEALNQQQFRWVLFPSNKHLRDMWTEDPPSEELKAIAAKAREIMGADSGVGKFMTQVIAGEIAAGNRGFAPDAKPLRAAMKPPAPQIITTVNQASPAAQTNDTVPVATVATGRIEKEPAQSAVADGGAPAGRGLIFGIASGLAAMTCLLGWLKLRKRR